LLVEPVSDEPCPDWSVLSWFARERSAVGPCQLGRSGKGHLPVGWEMEWQTLQLKGSMLTPRP
jgi:hypothetical protein